MIFAHATDTQVAISKTEQANRDAQSTQAADTQAAVILSTGQAAQTQSRQTQQATITQGMQTAWAKVAATSLAATQQIQNSQLWAKQTSIWGGILLAVIVIILLLIRLGVYVWSSIKIAQADYLQRSRMAHDAHGRLDAVPEDALNGKGLVNPNLAYRAVLDPKKDELTTEQALANVESHRALESTRAVADAYAVARRLPKPPVKPDENFSVNVSTSAQPLLTNRLPLPGWELINGWQGGARPLGIGDRGLITANAASPHILVAGITGSGKTRFLIRPIVATALADHQQVVILSLSGNGYGVFDQHPNAYRIPLENATDVIPYLKCAYRELRERDRLIGGRDVTWDRFPNGAPRPTILLVLEELGNMAETIYTDEGDPRACAEMWNWVTMLAREGRKVGMEFIAAVQEPTAKSVDLRFRRNCTRVSFQLAEQISSQTFLGTGGAEKLHQGYFMALVNGLVVGGGFSPNDDEIAAFLDRHPAEKLAEPEWVNAQVTDLPATADQGQPKADAKKSDPALDFEIWRLYTQENWSQAKIEQELFGYKGGEAYNRVAAVLKRYQEKITTTTGNMPGSSPVAA